MSFKKRALARLALSLSICAIAATAQAADDGLINQAEQVFGERDHSAI
jgi:hypothetical protein